jgi:hypothetical protein
MYGYRNDSPDNGHTRHRRRLKTIKSVVVQKLRQKSDHVPQQGLDTKTARQTVLSVCQDVILRVRNLFQWFRAGLFRK